MQCLSPVWNMMTRKNMFPQLNSRSPSSYSYST